ncbi:FMRFamide receptor [Elysia marginata]|uniref:FMRFamide receptor n=1 Tax=Elysia marginata TaxID=1093978 RepID=A0AAV4GYJ6_9GAST|nr:FMRFamide receptor [Elysia marginata]
MQLGNISMVGLASALPTSPQVFPYATNPPRAPLQPPTPPPLPACFNETSSDANRTLTSEERMADLVKWAIMDVTVPIVCALGLVGNLLSLVVLTTEKLHRTLTKMEVSAHIGLIALAVSDFLFCLLVLVFTQVSY